MTRLRPFIFAAALLLSFPAAADDGEHIPWQFQRAPHQAAIDNTAQRWLNEYNAKAPAREQTAAWYATTRAAHQTGMDAQGRRFIDNWHAGAPARQAQTTMIETRRAAHQAGIDPAPARWHADWATRQPYDRPYDR